jgi:hypothetical protein
MHTLSAYDYVYTPSVYVHTYVHASPRSPKRKEIEKEKEKKNRKNAPHFAEELGALVLAHDVGSSTRLNVIAFWRWRCGWGRGRV